ncbi:hypothetical protein BV22DRAFT_885991 [Leucogyrophana mollusca]|uniref:Uncharacterized protein n=1 Tax=Leucogyrophana mollusca TaxID=85980 RepID=A0ACB8AZY8_9AGAM|nr:hypothetical protein BV22DRAFT_885991 [Leucogyrophana mollusca]
MSIRRIRAGRTEVRVTPEAIPPCLLTRSQTRTRRLRDTKRGALVREVCRVDGTCIFYATSGYPTSMSNTPGNPREDGFGGMAALSNDRTGENDTRYEFGCPASWCVSRPAHFLRMCSPTKHSSMNCGSARSHRLWCFHTFIHFRATTPPFKT